MSSTRRVSGLLGLSQSRVVSHLHKSGKNIWSNWIGPYVTKILQNLWFPPSSSRIALKDPSNKIVTILNVKTAWKIKFKDFKFHEVFYKNFLVFALDMFMIVSLFFRFGTDILNFSTSRSIFPAFESTILLFGVYLILREVLHTSCWFVFYIFHNVLITFDLCLSTLFEHPAPNMYTLLYIHQMSFKLCCPNFLLSSSFFRDVLKVTL